MKFKQIIIDMVEDHLANTALPCEVAKISVNESLSQFDIRIRFVGGEDRLWDFLMGRIIDLPIMEEDEQSLSLRDIWAIALGQLEDFNKRFPSKLEEHLAQWQRWVEEEDDDEIGI